MAYVSLYRRYRPQTFEDVVGQGHVTRTLIHAIEEDRLHHAYLFTGPRGTGKTSTARILAKAINCEQGPTPTPCNRCVSCVAITEGSSVDVIELDMASHGGVDDARELRDRALFAPASARRKVYVLDEVHMASTAAFNALLKLVEEPPAHVLFAMATTDPQKVLPTILSRVQRLDLRRVSAADVAVHVRRVCEAEGYAIEDGAVDAVVRAGDGSVRDTLSILEQVLAFSGTEVTAQAVAQVLGHTPAERVAETVERLAARDLAGLLALVQGLIDDGHDLRRFTLDLVAHLRDVLVLQVAPDHPDLVDATDERRAQVAAQAALLPRETLLRAVDLLAGTVAEQRHGSPRLPLELALAKLAVPGTDGDVVELADRVARMEAALSGTPAAAAGTARQAPAPTAAAPTTADHADPARDRGPAPDAVPDPEPDAMPDPGAEAVPDPGADAVPDPEPDAVPDVVRESPADAAAEPAAAAGEPAAAAGSPGDELAVVQAHWEAILELLRQRSRRCHAIFLPSTPIRLSRGVLSLRFGARYASFHAANARKEEFAGVLREAVVQATGLEVRLEVVTEGDDERRRPVPPSVTPDDARTPVLDDDPAGPLARVPEADGGGGSPSQPVPVEPAPAGSAPPPADGPSPDEEAEVREAELAPVAGDGDVDVDELLVTELDAELVDEQPPPGAGGRA